MITIILCIIMIVLWTIISLGKPGYAWDIEYFVYVLGVFILLGPIYFTTVDAFLIYPNLIGQKTKIEILQQNVEQVKAAYYEEERSEKAIVNGSLTNMWQSSKLSDYLIDLSKEKAEYSKKLEVAKLYRNNWIYILFWKGTFISKKVNEI